MRNLITALLLSTASLCAQDTAAAPQQTESAPQPDSLLSKAAEFNGNSTLHDMQQLISSGANVQERDSEGNTPLLYLCRPLEMDYRYTTDPHFAQALDTAIELMLKHGASLIMENDKGCNAAFYLQSKPELIDKLKKQGLIGKELAVKIPHDSISFYRYIRKRTEQARLTKHNACRLYLIRKYCAPAYERAEKRLSEMISIDSTRSFSYSDVCDLLAFMRLADEEKARHFVQNLHYWSHGEHLLEERPAQVLEALNLLHWDVEPTYLKQALEKLDTMLPTSPDEMIDCFAAAPMGILLEMLERREGDNILPLIHKYANGHEAELAYRAYKLLLKREGLPTPTPQELMERYTANGATTPESLTPEQRHIYECAMTDAALNSGNISNLTTDTAQRAIQAFNDMQLKQHADIVATLIVDGELTTDPYLIQAAYHKYIEQPPPSPRIVMARYILANPAIFAARNTEDR